MVSLNTTLFFPFHTSRLVFVLYSYTTVNCKGGRPRGAWGCAAIPSPQSQGLRVLGSELITQGGGGEAVPVLITAPSTPTLHRAY